MRLLDFASDTYSQCGEDGIIAKILGMLPDRNHWCVEFGAWDGQHLSNTCSLIEKERYAAVLIEPDQSRFDRLRDRHGTNEKVVPINRFVGFSHRDNLDAILADTPIPKDFDFLSIDIDGNDYHVWKAMSAYRPKLVCIEYNPTIPSEVDFVQARDPNASQGSSLLALTRLAREKEYELICATRLNAFYIPASLFPAFSIRDNSISVLREDRSAITHFFCGYDGTLFLSGAERSPWNDIRYQARIRQLPKVFRIYVGIQSPLRFHAFRLYRAVSRLLGRA